MPRAIGISLAFDQARGPFEVTPVGVFLESVDGAYMEYQFPTQLTDEADEDVLGFREYWQTGDSLGDLPIWWKTLGVQNEVGLLDSLAESGQLITPREWLVWHAEHSSWFGVKLFIVSAVEDEEITLSQLYDLVVVERTLTAEDVPDGITFPDFDLVGLRPSLEVRGDTYEHRVWVQTTIEMVRSGIVGYRFPRDDDDNVRVVNDPFQWEPVQSVNPPTWGEGLPGPDEARRMLVRRIRRGSV